MSNLEQRYPSLQLRGSTASYSHKSPDSHLVPFLLRNSNESDTSRSNDSESHLIREWVIKNPNVYKILQEKSNYPSSKSSLNISKAGKGASISNHLENSSQISEISGVLESGFLDKPDEPFCTYPNCLERAEFICKCTDKSNLI
ncbi:unnamed protein product [Blepharisma stoltei]|uniref:Uncharacterized protein n=1 Tax=Blepharisma stoltei TaxID=1481888 RepID=A0AAU9J3N6_9CILI|nr:unnamed protein product [Blepharisma stoltei]